MENLKFVPRLKDSGWKEFTLLVTTMVALSTCVLFITIFVLYRASISELSARLADEAKSLGVIFETVAKMEEKEGWPKEFVLRQTLMVVESAHDFYGGYGETGEFTMAKREGEKIHYLLRHRHGVTDLPEEPPITGQLSKPMQKALEGYSGVVRGKDYRGVEVLSSVTPVMIGGKRYGLVVKIDMAEIRRPFVNAAITSAGIAAASILVALLLFNRIGGGLMRRLTGAERRAKESEEQYRLLLENTPDMVYRFAFLPERRFEYISPSVTAITGYTPEEHYADPDLERKILHPEDRQKLEEYMARPETWKEPLSIRGIHKNGHVYWVEQHNAPIYSPEGKLTGIQGVARDVTATVDARIKLERANRTLRMLSECNQALIRAETEKELFNQMCRIIAAGGDYPLVWVGLAEQDPGKSVVVASAAGPKTDYLKGIRITWDESPAGQGPTGTAIRTGKTVHFSDLMTEPRFGPWRENAVLHGFRSSVALPLTWQNATQGALMVYASEKEGFNTDALTLFEELAMDLSFGIKMLRERDQKSRAVAALWEKEMRISSLIDSSSDAIISADGGGRTIAWNMGAQNIFGYSAVEAIGKPLTIIIPPALRDRHEKAFARAVASGEFHLIGRSVELTAMRKNGEEFPVEFSLSAWQMHGERFFSAILRDISERKKAENEMRERNEELYRALEESKSAQALLVRTEKLAAIGTLSAGVAHEILNPLNIIGTITQLMQMDEKDADRSAKYKEIMNQVKRAGKITNNLRLFARKKTAERRPVDPRRVFDHTAALLERDLNLDNIMVDRDFAADLPPAFCDEDALAQVFINLMTNARDAMKQRRKGTLTVRMFAENGGVRINVCDDGPGIPANVMNRIFDPFFTTKEPGQGTGLGLAIVHRIVEESGGKLWVDGEEGKGACFHLWIPCPPAEEK